MNNPTSTRADRLLLWGFFVVILGSKLWLILQYGNSLPYWDQWDAEAAMFIARSEGTWSFSDFFAAHNEHRILWTRLLALSTLRLNSNVWDPLAQMTLNAVLHGSALVLLLSLLRRDLSRPAFLLLIGFSLVLIIPMGWENTLWGFQSQFYFVFLFSVMALHLLINKPPLRTAWWLGLLALTAAFLSMASGFLAGLAVVACMLLKMDWERKFDWRTILAIGILLLWVLVAYRLTPVVPDHAVFRAESGTAFLTALMIALSVPLLFHPYLMLFVQLPALSLAGFILTRSPAFRKTPPPWFLVSAILWFYLTVAAVAYGRGESGIGPVSRYLDTLLIGLVLNAAAALVLCNRMPLRRVRAMAVCWIALTVLGLLAVFQGQVFAAMNRHVTARRSQQQLVQQYLAESNEHVLLEQDWRSLPYPHPETLLARLNHPVIRHILPNTETDHQDRRKGLLSGFTALLRRAWPVLIALGVVLLGIGSHRSYRSGTRYR